jgi:hypothetical protein
MKVYVWLPIKKSKFFGTHAKGLLNKNSGHVAIEIAGRYFSFSTEGKKPKWVSTIAEDNEYHRNEKNKLFTLELEVDESLHPYILSIFSIAYKYPGLSGFRYGLRSNNCCTVVASFLQVAVTAYLINIFSNKDEQTFWKKQSIQASKLRQNAINKYYPQREEGSIFDRLDRFSNREAILQEWTLYHLYVMALVDLHDPLGASEILAYKASEGHGGGQVLWHPLRALIYARFAKRFLEAHSHIMLKIPRVYRVGMDEYGAYESRKLPSTEQLTIDFLSSSSVRRSIDMAFLSPTGPG